MEASMDTDTDMKLELRTRGVEPTEELKSYVARRLQFALARFGNRVRRVIVHLEDVNGPRGGEDIRCRLQAHLAPRGELVIRELNTEPFTAVSNAAERLASSIQRRVERSRVLQRRRA